MLLGCSVSLLLLLLICLTEPVESGTLHLNSCSVNVHMHELCCILTMVCLYQEGQTCCFIRLVLRFYVERVFSNYASSHPQQQRCSSALANAFISIRRDIHKCHCLCEEETQRKMDSVHAEFIKLQISQAAQKAVGELDTVLEWLEEQKTQA
uniref:Interleukin-20-like n=1 Tax=Acanthochromis polyacanthus TaxID=80966 RepID=A0A3Q1FDD6_9TELE